MSHNIAPPIGNRWYPQGHVAERGSHHCGKCMNPFLSGADCSCHCHTAPTETRGINRSGDVNHPVEGLGRDNMKTPVAGAEREGKNDE